MEIHDIRQRRLRALVALYGTQEKLANAAGISRNYLSRLLLRSTSVHRKNLGEELARNIEMNLTLPPFYLDYTSDQDVPQIDSADRWPFTTPLKRLLRLSPDDRQKIDRAVEWLITTCEQGKGLRDLPR